MRTLARALGIAASLTLGAGCLRPTELACDLDRDCSGGVCEPTGRCSFTDLSCPGGRRYGEGAGALSGDCVGGGGDVDGGGPDAPGGDATDPPVDGMGADLIPHVRLQDEMVGLASADFVTDVTIDTSALTVTPNLLLAPLVLVPQDGGGPDLVLLRAGAFTLRSNRTVVVVGSRPLVVLADTVLIQGSLDVGARGSVPGPGGFASPLGTGVGGIGQHDGLSDGGGGGGGFGTAGGLGGTGGAAAGGGAGSVHGDPAITVLHGGSPGGRVFGAAGCATRIGGGGGGALQIYAASSLTITASGGINAGGGGGDGGLVCAADRYAGSGGGSGGAVYLQSPMLVNQGFVAANGGGGGAGAAGVGDGPDGSDGVLGLGGAAGGDASGQFAGDGGLGSMGDQAGGVGQSRASDGNGGGGGGGGGRIVLRYDTNLAIGSTSPTATLISD